MTDTIDYKIAIPVTAVFRIELDEVFVHAIGIAIRVEQVRETILSLTV